MTGAYGRAEAAVLRFGPPELSRDLAMFFQRGAMMHLSRVLVALTGALLLAGCAPPEERAADFLAKGRELFEARDYERATLELRNTLQLEPKNAEAHYLLAMIAEENGNLRELFGRLQLAVDSDPDFVPARVKLGELLWFAREFEGAIAQAEAALALDPQDRRARLLGVRITFLREGREAGFQALDALVADEPDFAEAIVLANLTLAETDPDEALARLEKAEPAVPERDLSALRQARAEILLKEERYAELEEAYRSLMRDYPALGFDKQLVELYLDRNEPAKAEALVRELIAKEPNDAEPRLLLTELLRVTGRPDEALASLAESVAALPEASELKLGLGELYELAGQPQQARAVYEELGAMDPRSEAGLEGRTRAAVISIKAGQASEGLAALDEVLELDPGFPGALVVRADLLISQGQYQDAVADLRAALRGRPDLERAKLLLARAHGLQGELTLAEDALRDLLRANPESPDALDDFASLLESTGRYDEAAVQLRSLRDQDPGRPLVRARLINALLAAGELEDAAAEAKMLQQLTGPGAMGDLQYARVLDAQGQYAEAARLLEGVIENKPDSPAAIRFYAEVLARDGRAAQAVTYLRRHAERYPEQLEVRVLLGQALAATGRRDEARQVLEDVLAKQPVKDAYETLAAMSTDTGPRQAALKRGLEAFPHDATLVFALSQELLKAGRVDEAIQLYEDAIAAGPVSNVILNNLAALLLDYREDEASHRRALIMMANLERSRNPVFLDTLGWANYRNGLADTAVPILERAVAAAPDAYDARYHLGMAYGATGNVTGARQELARVVAEAPAESPVREQAQAALAALPEEAAAVR